jgi:hypothetical protein
VYCGTTYSFFKKIEVSYMIVNMISSNKGGGAKLLVHELHRIYLKQGLDSVAIYSTGCKEDLGDNEIILVLNPRRV